jgi:asparagine synthase (glutamine-hydrolysing)
MCGICGVLAPPPVSGLLASVRAMADTLAHRGPDGEGYWTDAAAGVGLGHRRLAIIDLTPGGRQPMRSTAGRFAITYNGEIYNYRDLRRDLTGAGTRFRTQSDTEVLLEACARWGVEVAASRLIGIFAFALWDAEERTLYLVRDQFGVKPVYWTRLKSAFVFGSELRALAAHGAWAPKVDRDALAAFLRHGYVPAPKTIYEDVFKLPPGSILVVRAGEVPEVKRYWDARATAIDGIAKAEALGDSDAVGRLDGLLTSAIERQMISDVPLGAFLSGGIDSSTVVALMQARSAKPIKTFTIGFHEDGYNEADHARAVARHLGTDHTDLYVTAEQALSLVPSIADWFDEPFADASQIPTFLVAQLARRQVTVALSGDGGDEVFAGYNRYSFADAWWRWLRRLRPQLRPIAARALRAVSPSAWNRLFSPIPTIWRPRMIGDKLHKVADLLTVDDANAAYRRLVSQWNDPERVAVGGRETKGLLWDESVADDIPNFIERMQFLDTVTYLPDDILTKVDRASMAVSLEARVPLLDPDVFRFAWTLPLRMRMRGGQGKWLLRQVLYRHVPPRLVNRPKMGFAVPIDRWLRGPLRDWAEGLLDEARLRQEGFLDPMVVRSRWSEHLRGHRNWQYSLWCVLMFQEWQDRWLKYRPMATPDPPSTVFD